MEWYHCGRCGSFFRAPSGDPDERVCAKCGRDPSLGVDPQSVRGQSGQAKPAPQQAPDSNENREPHHGGRNNIVARLVLGWTLFMVIIVIAVKLIWSDDSPERGAGKATANAVKGTEGDETVVKIDQALPSCSTAFSGFLSASSSEERNQFVTDPVATASRMARFYSLNPVPRIDPSTLRNTENTLLNIPDVQAIETRWKSSDGLILDCVFVKQEDEWRIDWDHFARYQQYPWALFTTGEGPDEAEFRLLVRQRVTRDGSTSSHMDLVFSPPRFGHPRDAGSPTTEMMIRRASPEGRLLTAGFKQLSGGSPPFGSTLKFLEEDDMLRVRVTMRRVPNDDADGPKKWKFELVKVAACHWLSTNDPGVKPEPEKAGEKE